MTTCNSVITYKIYEYTFVCVCKYVGCTIRATRREWQHRHSKHGNKLTYHFNNNIAYTKTILHTTTDSIEAFEAERQFILKNYDELKDKCLNQRVPLNDGSQVNFWQWFKGEVGLDKRNQYHSYHIHNKEARNAYSRQYNIDNAERVNSYKRQWRANNAEHIRQYNRQYRQRKKVLSQMKLVE